MTAAWDLLVSGDIVGAVFEIFMSRFEPVPSMFLAVILLVGLTLVYLKTENFGTVGVVGLSLSIAILGALPAQVHLIGFIFLGLSITVIIVDLFTSKAARG